MVPVFNDDSMKVYWIDQTYFVMDCVRSEIFSNIRKFVFLASFFESSLICSLTVARFEIARKYNFVAYFVINCAFDPVIASRRFILKFPIEMLERFIATKRLKIGYF